MPPSPVSCAKPPSLAPRLRARMAFALSAPKLMAEMLKSDRAYGFRRHPFDRTRNDRMIDPLEVVAVDVLLSAERPLIERALRSLISNRAFRSIERRAVGFALQKILTDFGSDLFQHEADIGEDG